MKLRIDYHRVAHEHAAIHTRLQNWARWVTPRDSGWVAPMFRQYRANWRQWHDPAQLRPIDPLDALLVERAVAALTEPQRSALRWCYVVRCAPHVPCRQLALSYERLGAEIHDGREKLQSILKKVECFAKAER